ncbi:MAG: hypothetical protein CXZ00_03125 [Acidobacteria bacterium]|nr:MAG: hypothetical protein CXZ00_03125 [Acidobacteriota bacterium]
MNSELREAVQNLRNASGRASTVLDSISEDDFLTPGSVQFTLKEMSDTHSELERVLGKLQRLVDLDDLREYEAKRTARPVDVDENKRREAPMAQISVVITYEGDDSEIAQQLTQKLEQASVKLTEAINSIGSVVDLMNNPESDLNKTLDKFATELGIVCEEVAAQPVQTGVDPEAQPAEASATIAADETSSPAATLPTSALSPSGVLVHSAAAPVEPVPDEAATALDQAVVDPATVTT